MMPARATLMIHGAAQFVRTSVSTTASSRRPVCSTDASRTPMSAARSARVICKAWPIARVLRRQPRQRHPVPQRVELRFKARAGLDGHGRDIRALGSLDVVAPIQDVSDLDPGRGVARIQRGRPPQVFERPVEIPGATLDIGNFAIQNRAVGRPGNRLPVGRQGVVEVAAGGRLSSAGQVAFEQTEAHHLNAAPDIA